jgi:hypothetical protein
MRQVGQTVGMTGGWFRGASGGRARSRRGRHGRRRGEGKKVVATRGRGASAAGAMTRAVPQNLESTGAMRQRVRRHRKRGKTWE